jgi:hypothetical protein
VQIVLPFKPCRCAPQRWVVAKEVETGSVLSRVTRMTYSFSLVGSDSEKMSAIDSRGVSTSLEFPRRQRNKYSVRGIGITVKSGISVHTSPVARPVRDVDQSWHRRFTSLDQV